MSSVAVNLAPGGISKTLYLPVDSLYLPPIDSLSPPVGSVDKLEKDSNNVHINRVYRL